MKRSAAIHDGGHRSPAPAVAGSLIGRAHDLEATRALIDGGARLLTVVGAPGIGKTAFARRLLDGDRDLFVDLSGARDVDGAVGAVASALGQRDTSSRSVDAAARAVETALRAPSDRIVVLDNVEQIADALAPLVERWATASSGTTLLVTSREPLRVPSERCIPLAPLATPSTDELDCARILETDAVKLLVARASAHRAGYAPTAVDAPELGAIARAVDGIPLALELCAARLWLLGARAVRERVEAGIEILSRSSRGAVSRHETLAAAIGWSWDLLEPRERDALVRLSVARGGLDLDAATALLVDSPDAASRERALETLAALHEHSLVLVDERSGTPRYRAYEPVRAFASERRDHTAADARDRHARRFAHRAIRDGRQPALAVHRALLPDVENVLVACDHLLDAGESALAAEALAALAPIYVEGLHGSLDGYFARLTGALQRLEPTSEQAIARTQLARGVIAALLGDVGVSSASLEAARAAAESSGLRDVAAECWIRIARQRSIERRVDAANDAFAEAATRMDPAGHDELAALLAFQQGGAALRQLLLEDARRYLQRASALYGQLGNPAQQARTAANESLALVHAGRYDEALETADLGLSSARAGGLPRIECELLAVRGNVLALLGRLEESEEVTRRSIALSRTLGLTWFAELAHSGLTVVRLLQGRFAESLDLLAGVEAAYRAVGDRDRSAMTAARQAMAASELGRDALAEERLEAARSSTGSSAVDEVASAARIYVELARARARGDDAAVASTSARARALLADPAAAARTADARVIHACLAVALARATSEVDLVIGPDARWFRTAGGERVELLRRRAVRLVLERLARERLEAPGVALSVDALFAAGWPGERASADSARNRVHVTLTRLKDLGLRALLQSRDDGVLIAPDARVVRDPSP